MRKQAVVSAKIECYTCACKCTYFTEALLTAFHFDVSKDCHEIHPPMFCSKCELVLRRKFAAQKKHLKAGVTGVRVPPDYASGRTRGPRILGPPLGLPVRPDAWS